MAQLSLPKYTFMGEDSLEKARVQIKGCGKKALIVTGPHVVHSSMMETLKTCLNSVEVSYYVYSEITGEPTDTMIMKGAECFRSEYCDFVIGLGGGSPLDAAKAIAVMSKHTGSIADFLGNEIKGDYPLIVAIPTTAGTGSEATRFAVITDSKKDVKMLLRGDCILPEIAIVNPKFSIDMPKSVTAATGLDAFTHAIEAYISVKATEQTDGYAVTAVKRIMKYLPVAYRNGYDVEARKQMAIAAYEAGVCINNSSVTIVHGMSRPIGALFHVPHGKSNAMLLEACLNFAVDGARDRFAFLGRETGCAQPDDSDESAAQKFLNRVGEIIKICEIPTLRAYGIDEKEFTLAIEKMAKDAIASGSPGNTRRLVTEEDCKSLYLEVIQK